MPDPLRFLIALAVSALPAAAAAQMPIAGTWRAVAPVNGIRCTFDRVIVPTGTYSELEQCGPYKTAQSGTYTVFPNHTVSFVVTDWTPRQRYIVDAVPGTGHYETNARPPGGTFHVAFTSPDTMVWRDLNFGGTITFRRVR
jgi:hypothetical protein